NVRTGHSCGVSVDNIVVQSAVTVQADLSLAMTAAPNPVTSGTALSWSLTAHNGGPSSSQSVTVSDHIPSSVSYSSCASTGGGSCAGAGNDRTVSWTQLTNGETETATLTGQVSCSLANGSQIV